jgi:hypothetical protein
MLINGIDKETAGKNPLLWFFNSMVLPTKKEGCRGKLA